MPLFIITALLFLALLAAFYAGYKAGKFDEQSKYRERKKKQPSRMPDFSAEKYRAEVENKMLERLNKKE